MFDVVKTVLID